MTGQDDAVKLLFGAEGKLIRMQQSKTRVRVTKRAVTKRKRKKRKQR